jgi:hypothetical protein
MLRSELLEREAEARRIELAETFDELRTRATPGHVLNQLVSYATDSGGADFFRNLRDQTVANPLAVGLVGAGLAWLIMSRGTNGRERPGYDQYEADQYEARPSRSRMRSYFSGTRERAGAAMSDARHLMSDAAADVRDRVADAAYLASDAAGSIASTARSARDAALGTASSLGEQARSRAGDTTAALGSAASALYGGVAHSAGRTVSGVRAFASGTASTSQDLFDFARDQPLVLAGLGLAFGAAVGAAFSSTEAERQLMGEASDDLKERTQAFAAENYEKSRSVAESVYDEFQNRAREGGEPPGGQPPLTGSPGIVPVEEEITEIQKPIRPERIGLRDGHS